MIKKKAIAHQEQSLFLDTINHLLQNHSSYKAQEIR